MPHVKMIRMIIQHLHILLLIIRGYWQRKNRPLLPIGWYIISSERGHNWAAFALFRFEPACKHTQRNWYLIRLAGCRSEYVNYMLTVLYANNRSDTSLVDIANAFFIPVAPLNTVTYIHIRNRQTNVPYTLLHTNKHTDALTQTRACANIRAAHQLECVFNIFEQKLNDEAI